MVPMCWCRGSGEIVLGGGTGRVPPRSSVTCSASNSPRRKWRRLPDTLGHTYRDYTTQGGHYYCYC